MPSPRLPWGGRKEVNDDKQCGTGTCAGRRLGGTILSREVYVSRDEVYFWMGEQSVVLQGILDHVVEGIDGL